jgi:hypothetical protein
MHTFGSENELWTELKAWVAALDGASNFTTGELANLAAITTRMASSTVLHGHEVGTIISATKKALTRTTGSTD